MMTLFLTTSFRNFVSERLFTSEAIIYGPTYSFFPMNMHNVSHVLPLLLPFLYEEEKGKLLTVQTSWQSYYARYLHDVRADYYSLVQYHIHLHQERQWELGPSSERPFDWLDLEDYYASGYEDFIVDSD